MSFFRIHIIKITLIALSLTGLCILVWPWQNQSHRGESVSNWLFELRTDTENPEVYDKISSLRSENGDIPRLLRKASDIIRDHTEDFAIPVDPDDATNDEIYNTLLIKWSIQNRSAATSDTIMISERQSSVPNNPEKEDRSLMGQLSETVDFVLGVYTRISETINHIQRILRPLSGGISINAP
ncbi:hypothetical protein QLX67_03240 [Balneolaceae bacterium ANBcel3]|nr:hypothetical protein [Balneolaceae bacterium ANBcel3]